ncbi:MAG TPA: hypothetical protein DCL35_05560 [Candidatus Omnitrophica bacterium]|nr:hypothetical protein [Candidatus Omnitrophota bacterium]
MFRKIFSYILITTHIATFGFVRDAFAFQAQSAGFALTAGALTQGGGRQAGASLRLWQGAIAEPVAARSQSTSYSLESGFIPTIKSNPPVQSQIIPNQSWLENEAMAGVFDLDDYFSSPDGLTLIYSASGNTNISALIDPVTHAVSFSQAQAWFGTEKIRFTATDTEHNSVISNEVTLQVEGVDNPPVLTYIPDISINENELVTIAPSAADADGDVVTYSFAAPLDAQGAWQTNYNDAGLYSVNVTATDATGLSASQVVHINVVNVNRPPVLSPIADITANEGELVTIASVGTDADNDPVTFYYPAPFDTAGKWLTGYNDAGTHQVTVIASDGIDTVSQNVNVIVNNTNRAPEATLAISKYTADPNESLNITLSGNDADNDEMSYSIKKDGQIIATGALAGSVNVAVSFSTIGDHTITATVMDTGGLVAVQTAGIDIVDPNVNNKVIYPVMGDFNGDTLMDLGLYKSDTGLWEVAISQAGTFTNAVDWLINFGTGGTWLPVGGDFNGDGRTDVGIYNSASGEFKPALSTGSGFTVQGTWLTFAGASASWQIFTGNYNADKYTDLGFYNKDTGEVRVALGTGTGFSPVATWANGAGSSYAAMGGDFNADGLTDLCLFKKTAGEFKVIFSNSKAFVDGGVWLSGFATARDALLSDFNHDGLTDVGYWDNTSFAWNYAVSTGSSFITKGAWLGNFGASTDESATTGDFNGDGITDRALFDKDSQGINRWKVQVNTLKPSDLMTEIDNGIGGKTKVVYTYASRFDNQLLPFPVYVASSTGLIDTLPADQPEETYTQNFTYSGGYYDAVEREFRGFSKIRVTDPVTGNYTETYFHQGKPGQDGALKGQIDKALAYDGNSQQISQVINTYDVRKAGPADNVLGFPALTQVETTVWEENALPVTTRSIVTYDNIGNVIEAKDDGDVLKAGDEKSAATTYSPAYENGHNRPIEAVSKDKDANVVSKKSFEYDSKGNLSKEEVTIFDPLTLLSTLSAIRYTYDSFGNLTSATDALGRSVTTEYETAFYAYPQSVTNALGHSVSYVYDPKFGIVTSVTDSNGQTTTSSFDSFSRVVQSRNANNEVVSTHTYPDFNTKVIANALGLSKTEYADGLGRKYRSVSVGEDGAAARSVSAEVYFNNRGLVEKESIAHYIDEDPSQILYVRYEYDLRGRPKKTISDFPGTLKDAESQVNYINPLYVETIDPEGHKKGTLKDVYGNVIEVTEFTSGGVFKTKYEYDIQNNLTKTTDSKDNVTQIWYDSIGRKLKMDDPDMGVWTYEYDLLGNLVKQADAKNQVLEFHYDALNRLTKKVSLLGGAEAILSEYYYDDTTKENCVGRLSKIADQSGSTEFFYDNLGREIKSTKAVDGIPYTVERTYDILDRLVNLKYPDGEDVNYSYDPNSGLLESVVSLRGAAGDVAIHYANDIAYNAQGQIRDIHYGNGTETTYTYGQDLRLSRILTQGTAILQDLNYSFDKNGNITTLTDNLRSNIRTYAYDDLDRLTQANNVPSPTGGYANFNYQYDAIGNMTYKSDTGVMIYGVNAGPHAVTNAGGYNYSYDANGNMTSGKNKTLEYDAENRIIRVNNLGSITDFVYDGDGGRVKKITPTGTTTYIGSLFEIDSSSGKATKHIFAGSTKVASVSLRGSEAAEAIFYHSDHLGSSSVITDQNGQQVSHYEYTPYGSVAQVEGSDVTGYKFTGKELDNTGLYFYGARYYDPEIGRFVTADTIVQAPYDPQSLNRYTYCRNNPLNYVDPTGHLWWLAALIFIAKAAAVISIGALAAGGIAYAAGNSNLAATFFQISTISGYVAAAAGVAGFVGAAMTAARNQTINASSLIMGFSDDTAVDLGTITVTPNAPMAIGAAWEVTKDAVMAGVTGAVSAAGSAVAAVAGAVNSAAYAGAEFVVNKINNGFNRCPRYGNWGGEDWSGRQQIRKGEIGFGSVPAVNQMDGYFKQHDFSVYSALKVSSPTTRRALVLHANRILYGQLRSLPEDPTKWSFPAKDPVEARAYRKKAELWFNPKNPFQ